MQPQVPSTVQLVRAYGRIGLLGFGGPAAQTALLSRVVVEEQGWLDARRFADGLALCSVLPGPEAMQLAVWSGWRVAGARGAWIAGSLFVLPGAVLVWGLAVLYAQWGAMPASAPWLAALRCAVVCLVVSALVRLAPRVLLTWREVLLAGAASVW
jgi:chromate transporter